MSPSRETTLTVSLPATRMQDAPIMRPCRKFEGHTNWVTCALHLPGRQQIMTSSWDRSLRVWNLQTGKQISVWPNEGFCASSIALSPNGKKVAIVGGWGGLLKLYDVDTGKVIATSAQFGHGCMPVVWSGDGRRVMSMGYSLDCDDPLSFRSVVKVWDLVSEKTILEIDTGISGLRSTIYSGSPDMTMIAAGGKPSGQSEKDTFIKIWDANTGKLVANLKEHTRTVYCLQVAWTADGSTLISGSSDRSIRTWDTSTWQQTTVFTVHTNAIHEIAIHPTAHILASASWDGTARLWNFGNGQPIGPLLQHAENVHCVSFSTDGNLLTTGCWDNNAYTWDISSILRDAGLVLNPNGGHHHQALLNTDVTQLAGQRHKNSTHRLHPDFFQETPRHPDPLRSSRILPTSARYETPSQSHFLAWAHNSFNQSRRRNDKDTKLLDVPLGQRKFMYYSANELRIKEEKEKEKRKRKARAAKNAPVSSAVQPPAGVRHAQPSEMHTSASIPSSTSAVIGAPAAISSTTSLTNENVPQARWWTRFICSS